MAESFSVARGVSVLVEVLGWCGVAGAAANVGMSYGRSDPMPYLTLAAVLAGAGLVAVVAGQFARAQIATAESSSETADLLRQVLRELRGGDPSRPAAASGPLPANFVKTYKGQRILRAEIGFSIDGVGRYPTVIEAEKAIDGRL